MTQNGKNGDLCSFHSEFSQQVMGILNNIRGDVRWILKIGGFGIIMSGALLSMIFPMIRDLVSSMTSLRQEISLNSTRIGVLEKNEEKLFEAKDKRDSQIAEMIRRLDAVGR